MPLFIVCCARHFLTVKIVTIQAYDETSFKTVTEQVASIKSLAGKGVEKVHVLPRDAPRPAGSVSYPVSTVAAAYLYVKGRVDMDAEIAKAQKKLDKALASVKKQEKIFMDPSYKEKVSPAVQETDEAKLAEVKQEAKVFEETIQQFQQLKLE